MLLAGKPAPARASMQGGFVRESRYPDPSGGLPDGYYGQQQAADFTDDDSYYEPDRVVLYPATRQIGSTAVPTSPGTATPTVPTPGTATPQEVAGSAHQAAGAGGAAGPGAARTAGIPGEDSGAVAGAGAVSLASAAATAGGGTVAGPTIDPAIGIPGQISGAPNPASSNYSGEAGGFDAAQGASSLQAPHASAQGTAIGTVVPPGADSIVGGVSNLSVVAADKPAVRFASLDGAENPAAVN